MLVIRRATAADSASLASLNEHVHGLHLERDPTRYRPPAPEAVAAWFAGLLAQDTDIFVASEDGRDLAYAVVLLRESSGTPFTHPSRFAHVDQIAVDAARRGEGIGRALMAHVRAFAAERGYPRVALDVASFNDAAIRFYEGLGFEVVQLRMATRSTTSG